MYIASVEEVIDKHYQNQIDNIEEDEIELKKIIRFREDELHHKDIAYEKGATKEGLYFYFDKLIKTGSKIAIRISEKNLIKVLTQHPNTNSQSKFYAKNLEENFYHSYVDLQLLVDKDVGGVSFLIFVKVSSIFLTLQLEHAVTTLSQSVLPPFDLGSK